MDQEKNLDHLLNGENSEEKSVITTLTANDMPDAASDNISDDENFLEKSIGSVVPPSAPSEEGSEESAKPKNNLKWVVIGGSIGLLTLLLIAGGFMVMKSQTQPEQVAAQPEPTIPTLEAVASETVTSNIVASAASEPVLTVASQLEVIASHHKVGEPVAASQVKPPEQQFVGEDLPMPTPVIASSVPETQVPVPVLEKPETKVYVNPTNPDLLRAEAQQLLAKANELEKTRKIDEQLVGKSVEEQLLFLKHRVIELEKVIENTEIVEKQTNAKVTTKSEKLVKYVKNPYQIESMVYGQVWIKDSQGTVKPYVVGDILPFAKGSSVSGAMIKDILADNRTIVTNKGTIQVN